MLERARAKSQLDKIQNSILMIDMQKSTLEGTAMDLTVLEALKSSGDTLRQMGATGQGLRAVEDLVSTIEESMQVQQYTCVLTCLCVQMLSCTVQHHIQRDFSDRYARCMSPEHSVGLQRMSYTHTHTHTLHVQSAAEITTVLSSGSVSGIVNSMASYGVAIDEDELMRELDDMLSMEDGLPENETGVEEDVVKSPNALMLRPSTNSAQGTQKQITHSKTKIPTLKQKMPLVKETEEYHEDNGNAVQSRIQELHA